MLVSEIILETREIVQEKNASNAHKTDAGILADINACTLQLCSTISTLPKVSVAGIVAANIISFASNLLKLDYASIYDGQKHVKLDTIDFPNFQRITPNWEDQQANKPTTLVRMDDLNWMLWPNPDAASVGNAMTIIGTVLPTPLTLTTETPPISITLHPAYPHYCAWKYFLVLNNPERAAQEYATFDGLRKLNTQTATSTTGSLLSFKIRGN